MNAPHPHQPPRALLLCEYYNTYTMHSTEFQQNAGAWPVCVVRSESNVISLCIRKLYNYMNIYMNMYKHNEEML